MDVRILTWTLSFFTGLLITGTGVHLFRCSTYATYAKYGNDSFLLYLCPFPVNHYDIILSVPQLNEYSASFHEKKNSWGLPSFDRTASTTVNLSHHNVYKDWITLSGFSSGGTFAQQLQISYSSLFYGIATFTHAYYRCGPGTGTEAEYDDACTIVGANRTYDPELAIADIREYERQGLIENTQNLRNKRLYVYAGSRSAFFDLDLSLTVVRIYEPFIQNLCAIRTRVQDASQVLPTFNSGAPCREESSPETLFLGNCGLSGAFEALRFLLGDTIRSPQNGPRANMANLMAFDQTEFFYGFDGQHFMDNVGYIYVPTHCFERTCLLHFYFHGCLTGREFNGTSHLVNSGYLELAEANDLIIVAPQAIGSQENMIGCWDTYGLTGKLYATQRGAQVTVVRNILARILGENNQIDQPTTKQILRLGGSLLHSSQRDNIAFSKNYNNFAVFPGYQ